MPDSNTQLEPLISWGKTHDGNPYSAGWDCRECGWAFMQGARANYEQIVGLEILQEPADDAMYRLMNAMSGVNDPKIGIIVIECPKCFEKFWFHVSKDYINQVNGLANESLNYGKDLIPNWPKNRDWS